MSLLVAAVSCEKKPFDYRNKYTGEYDLIYKYNAWNFNSGITEETTAEYEGEISYSKKGSADNLLLEVENGHKIEMRVDKNGRLTFACGANVGMFTGKTLQLDFSSQSCGGGMGQATEFSIHGKKN